MSSDRIDRKRRSDYSDDSSDEIPPVKARRLETPKTFHKLKLVTEAFKNFLSWITPEFVRNMTVRISHQPGSSSLKMDSANQCIEVDDDEDVEVLNVQNGSTGARPRIPTHQRSTRSSNADICPLASTPITYHSSDNFFQNRVSRTIERRKKLNGCATGIEAGKDDKIRLRSASEKCVAPISNPRSEIEILLENDDSKEIEFLKEVYTRKPTSGPTRKTRFLSDRACKKDKINYVDDFISCARSYTANEVVRLQEKAQYGLLLDRVVKRACYSPAFPKKCSSTSAIQVDLTEDDDNPESSYHFKKEKVEIMNDFLSKYYKPCELVPYVPKKESQLNQTLSLIQKDTLSDDDIQIIENSDLPKLRPRKVSTQVSDIFSNQWIEDLKMTISTETEKRLQIVAEQEEKVKRYKKRRDAKIADEKRKREEMRLAGLLSDDDVEMDGEVLPDITPEMEAVICHAFAHGDPFETLIEFNKNPIKRNDIATLSNLNWLNDVVINTYLELIAERSKLDNYPSVHLFNSFFYSSLKRSGPQKMLRWVKKIDIFTYDLMLLPLHLDLHWALLVVDNRSKEIKYYDSMGSSEEKCLSFMRDFLAVVVREKNKTGIDPNSYSLVVPKNIPKQMNGSDCGMFTLKYAEYLSRDAPITFTQENMPYFRRRMVYEILSLKIL